MNPYSTELCHHGILGQKWGVRRFQNEDGSVTAAGAKRYHVESRKLGGSKIVDENGKKIKRSVVRQTIKNIKQNDKEEYKRFKQLRKMSESGRMYYAGNDFNTAVMVGSINRTHKYMSQEAKYKVNEIIAKYANTPISSINK